jgi:Flp pilus assembly pilin Flp
MPGSIKSLVNSFCAEEDGMGVVEVILIIVVLISLVIIFKSQITSLVNSIMSSIKKDAEGVYKGS